MNEPNQTVIKREQTSVEYIPFGAEDKIKITVGIIQNLVAVKTKSGKTCSERDAIKFMAMCQAKRMNPFEGDCFLIGYDGRDGASFTLVTAHQTYLKRAELHPEFDGMKSGIIVQEDGVLKDLEGDFYLEGPQKVVGGWATVLFKNRKQVMHRRLRLTRFQKSFGVWQEDAAGMICKCAEADALRSSFPTMLGGLYMREELEVEPKTTKPIFKSKPLTIVETETQGQSTPSEPESERFEEAAETPNNSPASEPLPTNLAQPRAGYNPLKALRSLLAAGSIKEGRLLDLWTAEGATDGSSGSLEEVQMTHPELMTATTERWGDTLAKLKASTDK